MPAGLLIRLFPPVFRPMIGGLVRAWRVRQYHRSLFQSLVPPIAKLVQESQQVGKSSNTEQSTFVSWWLQESIDTQNSKAMDPAVIAAVIIQLTFAGLHTATLTATSTMYHILSFKDSAALVEELREEIARSSADAEGHWTWACLEKMTLLDSVIRESLRCSPIDAIAINRTIIKSVETPDGLHLPAGTRVCVPAHLAHTDEEHYVEASTFDPYRFVKSDEKAWTVTDSFTTFGSGVHVSNLFIFGDSSEGLLGNLVANEERGRSAQGVGLRLQR
jgi:cytochrome P450